MRPLPPHAAARAARLGRSLALVAALVLPLPGSRAAWKDATSGAVSDTSSTIGVSFVDIDLDGDPDLHFLNQIIGGGFDSSDRVLRNDGGDFVRVGPPALESPETGWTGAWADMDGDGDLDVFVAGSPSRLYRNDGGAFVDVTAPPLDVPGIGSAATWADFDLDGDLDLALAWSMIPLPGPGVRFLQNLGSGSFADVTPPWLQSRQISVQSIPWGDWDDDGDPDPYLVCTPCSYGPGPNILLRNDLAGSFADVTAPPLDDGGFGHGGVWGDVDNDGDLDMYVTNLFGPNRMFLNKNGTFVDATWGLLGDPADVAGVAFGDYDNDGWLDLYYAVALGPNRLLHNETWQGELTFTDATEDPLWDLGVGGGLAFGDYDEDGDLDLVLANIDRQSDRLFRNDLAPGTASFLRIDLVGTVSNGFGVGARIELEEDGLTQIREIAAGEGFCSQAPLTAHFGLGPPRAGDTTVDRLTVRWPSGIVQTLSGVPAGARIAIVEENPTVVPIPGALGEAAPGMRLFPNPFRGETELRFDLTTAGPARVIVLDVAGRPVRVVMSRQLGAGSHRAVWDGRDERGRPVSTGVYFLRLDAPGGPRTGKVVRIGR